MNKNYNHNDNESFMEGIYGCLERIEAGINDLKNVQPIVSNSAVDNEANETLVQEIKTAVDNCCNREHLEETNAKLTKFVKAIFNDYARIFNQMDALIKKEHPDFEGVKQLLAEATEKMDEIKVEHNINENRHSFMLLTKWDWFITLSICFIIGSLGAAYYNASLPNLQEEDNDLKYRYIKMKGDASAEQIATLEEIFKLNRNTEAINQMREDVETHEEAVRKQAALAEQARLKEQAAKEQETKAKSIKAKLEQKDNPNKKSKP